MEKEFKINNVVKIDPAFLIIYNQFDEKYNGTRIVMDTNFDKRFVKVLMKRARGETEDLLWILADHLEIITKDCKHFQL